VTGAFQQGAGRVLTVDGIASRLEQARTRGAEAIDFNAEDRVAAVRELTAGIGVDRVLDAVGVDAQRPKTGPVTEQAEQQARTFEQERAQVAPQQNPQGGNCVPGDAPSQALAVGGPGRRQGRLDRHHRRLPTAADQLPDRRGDEQQPRREDGNCNHRRYLAAADHLVRTGAVDPSTVLTQVEELPSVIEAYQSFDRGRPAGPRLPSTPPSPDGGRSAGAMGPAAAGGAGRPHTPGSNGFPGERSGHAVPTRSTSGR
jgi:threonine dehydrogenase-like Zn-dependent dehydrogenase